METINMDWETRSEADLESVGAYMYAIHPSTEILCLAYDLKDGKGKRIWKHIQPGGRRVPPPADLMLFINKNWETMIIRAHNASFEFNIWQYHCVKRHRFPPIRINQLDCSAAQAAALALPRGLDGLGKAIGAKVQKDLAGKAIMQKMTKPRTPKKNEVNPPKWHEDPSDFEILWRYCINDVASEESATDSMPKLDPQAMRLYHLIEKINDRGIYCDVPLCKIAVKFAHKYSQKILLELPGLTDGRISTANQHAKIKVFLSELGCDLPNTQAETIDLALQRTDLHPKAKRLLEIRQALGKSSLSKYETMIAMAGPDSRIRGTLLYHGASTGRLSGRGIQPQNFPARVKYKDPDTILAALAMDDYDFFKCLYPDVFGALSAALRGMLRAPKGKTLIAADFASIEVRVLFWIAQCELGLNLYRKGVDLYVDMAQDAYGITDPKKVTKDQRFVGKELVLGSGFGLGHLKFIESCLKKRVVIAVPDAKKYINSYREKFWEVCQFWRDIEAGCIEAVKTGKLIKVSYLQILVKNGYLFIRLPSGRKIAYYKPQVKMEENKFGKWKATLSYMAVNSKTKQWVREHTYGGKLTENIVQGIAADLMYFGMHKAEEANLPVILSVHDELISEIDFDQCTVKEYEELITQRPPWGLDIPIKSEGWVNERYKK